MTYFLVRTAMLVRRRRSSKSFLLSGLKLNLNIESNEYVPEISQAAGARIVIHPQGEMPFPDEEGVNLVPGFSTAIGVRRVEIYFSSLLYHLYHHHLFCILLCHLLSRYIFNTRSKELLSIHL